MCIVWPSNTYANPLIQFTTKQANLPKSVILSNSNTHIPSELTSMSYEHPLFYSPISPPQLISPCTCSPLNVALAAGRFPAIFFDVGTLVLLPPPFSLAICASTAASCSILLTALVIAILYPPIQSLQLCLPLRLSTATSRFELILRWGRVLEAGTFVVVDADEGWVSCVARAAAAAARRCSRNERATFWAAETPDLIVWTSSRLTEAGIGMR